jgi:hypothetical protein
VGEEERTVVPTTSDELRGSCYPVRVCFDERGWTGWIRTRTGQELSIRAADLSRLGTALTELVAVIDGGDPATMTVEPTWDVSAPGRNIGLVLVPIGRREPSPARPGFPRPAAERCEPPQAAGKVTTKQDPCGVFGS